MRALTALALLGLAGCAAMHPRPDDPGLELLAPAAAGFTRTLRQQVTFEKSGHSLAAEVVTQIDPAHVKMVVLTSMGNRLLGLDWDGKRLQEDRSPMFPKELPAALILRDLQLAYWPAEAVRARLPREFELVATSTERHVRESGQDVIEIQYQGDPFRTPLTLTHHLWGYSLRIEQAADE